MKVIFIQQLLYEWSAPMLFSAIAKKRGWETDMYITPDPLKVRKYIMKYEPQLIVFASVTSGNMEYVYDCTCEIKRHVKIPVLVGGPHISLNYYDINMENIEYLSIGEGELAFSMLLEFLEGRKTLDAIPGIIYNSKKRNRTLHPPCYIHDLDEIPHMDRGLYYKYYVFREEKVRMFYSGRGCKYNCSYCCVPLLTKMDSKCALIRKRSPNDLIDEIKSVETCYGLKACFFQDDSFLQDEQWLKNFLPIYKAMIDKPFMCMGRASDLNEEKIDLLYKNGCVGIGLGIETSNEDIREKVLNRYESNEHIKNVISLLRERGIKITTFNMIGIPGETIMDVKNTINFNKNLSVNSAWSVLYQPYVNTDEFKECTKIKIANNFYTSLGYECETKAFVEKYQKLFSLFVNMPTKSLSILENMPNSVAFFLFSLHSFLREVYIWRRSFFLTLLTGIWNQVQYKKTRR